MEGPEPQLCMLAKCMGFELRAFWVMPLCSEVLLHISEPQFSHL